MSEEKRTQTDVHRADLNQGIGCRALRINAKHLRTIAASRAFP